MSKETKKTLTLFALTWPIFIELLLHMLMGNADTLMLSQYSDQSVAAVGVSNQILSLVIVMFGFISTGTAVLIAQNIGAKKKSTAKEVAVVSIALNLIFGLALSLLVFFFYRPILAIMDLPSELYAEAGVYLKIVGGFAFIQAIIMTIGAIVRSYGFTKDIMYITIGMNIINVIGNYLFIFGPFGIPVLGVEGVAISTAVSRFVGLIAAIIILFKRVPGKLPFQMLWRIPKTHTRNLLRIGVPSAGENLSYNASQMVITIFIAMLGTGALTSKVYVQNITMFLMLFGMAIAQGTQIIVGHMIGGKELEQAYKRGLDSLKKAIIIAICMAIVASVFSKGLLGIFTTNQDIIQTGSILIILSIILEPGRAFNMVLINALRAAGDVKFPVYIGIMSMWGVAVPLSYILGIYFEMGLIGVWISFIADEWLRGILMLKRWKARAWLEKARFFVT